MVDYPGAAFWRELADYYPEAKVLHSVRDPDQWFDSTQATIFAPGGDDLEIVREEVFGPVLTLFRFETLDDVVARANATRYGLSSYIWTRDIATGMRFAEQVRAGMCWINGYFLRDLRQPFGGRGQSGLGREGGRWSLDFFTEPKLVCIAY